MEDADGYMTIEPKARELYITPNPKETKDTCSNSPWWKIGLGISVAGNVALAFLIIFLPSSSPASRDTSYAQLPHNRIQSCLLNCVPCRAAKDSITANLTLDLNTAFPQLYISKDLKNVKWKGMKQPVKKDTLRYDVMASVLSHEGFTSGKICWEVEVVEGGQWWGVGIVRESANRNGPIFLAPAGGYWGVQRIDGQYQAITHPRTNLSLCQPPTRIRVSLDYSEGLVAFFNGDTNEQLFAFPKATFSGERILAWFLIHGWNGELMIHP